MRSTSRAQCCWEPRWAAASRSISRSPTPPEWMALVTVAAGISGYPQTAQDRQLFAPVVDAFSSRDFSRAIALTIHIWVDGARRSPEEVDPVVRERVRSLYTDVLLRTREGGRPPDRLDPPAYDRLGEIQVPALVVVGAGDIPSAQDQSERIARAIPGARKQVFPRVAHLLNMEIPEEFNRAVLDFLREHRLAT